MIKESPCIQPHHYRYIATSLLLLIGECKFITIKDTMVARRATQFYCCRHITHDKTIRKLQWNIYVPTIGEVN